MAKPTKPADIDVLPEAKILWELESNISQLTGYLAVTGDKVASDKLAEIDASVRQLHSRAEELLKALGVPVPEPEIQPRSGGGK